MGLFENIWNKVSQDDGTGIRVITYESDDDLVFIYASGFVDTNKCSLDQWKNAFKSSLLKEGSYRVTRDQWMEKEKYYYDGPVREPFNALKIPEKEFTEAELTDLFEKCIIPSSQSTKEKISLFLNDYKKRGLLKDGKMMMNKAIKQELSHFIATFPSPLRVLEVNVQRLRRGEKAIGAEDSSGKTGFAMGTSKVRTTQAQLDSILVGGAKQAHSEKEESELSVKDLQKQVKKKPV